MVEQQSNCRTTAVETRQTEPASVNLVIENNHVAMSFTKFRGSDDHPQLTLILLSPQKEQHLCQKLMFQHGKPEKVLLAPFIKEAYGTKWSPICYFQCLNYSPEDNTQLLGIVLYTLSEQQQWTEKQEKAPEYVFEVIQISHILFSSKNEGFEKRCSVVQAEGGGEEKS